MALALNENGYDITMSHMDEFIKSSMKAQDAIIVRQKNRNK